MSPRHADTQIGGGGGSVHGSSRSAIEAAHASPRAATGSTRTTKAAGSSGGWTQTRTVARANPGWAGDSVASAPTIATGSRGTPVRRASQAAPRCVCLLTPVRHPPALWEDADGATILELGDRRPDRADGRAVLVGGDRPEERDEPVEGGVLVEQLGGGEVADVPSHRQGHQHGVDEGHVVGGDDVGARRDVLAAADLQVPQASSQPAERAEDRRHDGVCAPRGPPVSRGHRDRRRGWRRPASAAGWPRVPRWCRVPGRRLLPRRSATAG